jgi:tRNA(Arg) A34 adenosine deaminase TadA
MKISKIILVLNIVLVIGLLFQSQTYLFTPNQTISKKIEQKLFELGSKALDYMDVPVAAILIYEDSIIGEGYNTVNRDSDITGHAEVNCLNMAFKNMGGALHQLDRNRLKLYTTYEPCDMCKGILINENIKHIFFEQRKSTWQMVKSTLKHLRYGILKRRFDSDGLQERLFRLHPNYLKLRN